MPFHRLLNPFRRLTVPVPTFKFQNLHKTVRNTRFPLFTNINTNSQRRGAFPSSANHFLYTSQVRDRIAFPTLPELNTRGNAPSRNLENPLLHNTDTVVPQNHSRNLVRSHIAQFSPGERRDETDCRDRSTRRQRRRFRVSHCDKIAIRPFF
uniref:(northern house mosquito) hypothetical protein n=1 Tax=Culex pipiens TaxID=7175 RepID=A0A8D8G3Y2_CULPI